MTRPIAAFFVMAAVYGCDPSEPVTPATQPTPPAPPAAPSADPKPLQEDPGAQNGLAVSRAIAVLQPAKGSKVHGTVTFSARKGIETLQVQVELTGLPPGKHAYHVHQYGDCSSEDGKSAGTHFNFAGSSANPGEKIDRITGDLGELEAGKDGKASASTTVARATLQGPYSILGRSVIVHENGNDPKSPPMGAAGGRIACGVIGIADAGAASAAIPSSRRERGG